MRACQPHSHTKLRRALSPLGRLLFGAKNVTGKRAIDPTKRVREARFQEPPSAAILFGVSHHRAHHRARLAVGACDTCSCAVNFYKRRLPHWLPENKAIFLTWRLYGSLPAGRVANSRLSDGEKFKETEKILDRSLYGPVWLKDPRIAQLVVEAIVRGADELRHYALRSYSVMPNHIHLLIGAEASDSRDHARAQRNSKYERVASSKWIAVLAGRVL